MTTHNVPSSARTRSSHNARRRSTHDYDAYDEALGGGRDLAEQKGIDGLVGAPGEIMPGAIRTEQIADTAVIQNAVNVQNGPSTVTIDDTGLVVENGAVTFKDAYGSTVLDGYGFSSSWRKFLASFLYNSDFAAGQSSIGVSEVSGGDSDADYLASLSTSLPYWVVSALATGVTLGRVADANAASGVSLNFHDTTGGGGTTTVYQDIPIDPGFYYVPGFTIRADHIGGTIFASVTGAWRDATHGAIAGTAPGGTLNITSDVAAFTSYQLPGAVAPANARYLRVQIQVSFNVPGGDVWVSSVGVARDNQTGTAFPSLPYTGRRFFRTDLGMEFYWDGTRWASTQVFTAMIHPRDDITGQGDLSTQISVSTTAARAGLPPKVGASGVLVLAVDVTFFVNAGTALGISHKWVGTLQQVDSSGGGVGSSITIGIDAGASSAWRTMTVAGNFTLDPSAVFLQLGWAKTGTPGNLISSATVTYRLTAT